jgi:hypothetical protein
MLAMVKGYAGLCKTVPPKRDNATVHDCEKTAGSGKPGNLARSPAERSGGGFADSPDVPASVLGPWIGYSLHVGYRVECETSGLGTRGGQTSGRRKRRAVASAARTLDPRERPMARSAKSFLDDLIAAGFAFQALDCAA